MITQKQSPWSSAWLFARLTCAFTLWLPLLTFLLLKLKESPAFPASDWANALPWIYRTLWFPSLLGGALMGGLLLLLTRSTRYFHDPYDIGRAISLGAIGGSLCQTLAIILRHLWQFRQGLPHGFWLATAAIAGCLGGALFTAAALYRFSRKIPWEARPQSFGIFIVFVLLFFLTAMKADYLAFAAALVSSNTETRVVAQMLTLHRSTNPHLLASSLCHFLRAHDPERRKRAAQSLGMVGQPSAKILGQLEQAMQDADPSVREAAEGALERLKTRANVTRL